MIELKNKMAESKEEKVGFHKGALSTLAKEREEILKLLNDLAKDDKVLLMHGSVKAITKELSEEEQVKTKSEVEDLKERIERLEKVLDFAFSQLIETIYLSHQKISKRKKEKSEKDLYDQEE